MKILFVGNSNTYYNDMPGTLEALAHANGLDWQVESVTKGGWSFRQYADPADVMHEPLQAKLAEEWDIVFLQDRTEYPLTDLDASLKGAAAICGMMKKRPGRLFVYATFARNDGHPHLEKLGMTRTEMAEGVHTAMAAVAAHIGAELSDASGMFHYMKECHNDITDIEMYDADLGHPSAAGSYMVALLHYAAITGALPEKIAAVPSVRSANEAEILKNAVAEYLRCRDTQGNPKTRILFVGNSYTYFHDLPATFASIAAAEGYDWTVESVTRGGWSFAQYADPKNIMHSPLIRKLIRPWDAIFLQEQSYRPISDRENFLGGARDVCALMKNKPARLFFYATWGRKDGCPLLDELQMTRLSMTEALHDAYAEAAEQNGGILSDAGNAFAYTMEHYPQINLYTADLSHPSDQGSYLAALIHYASFTGSLPDAVRFVPANVSAEEAEQLLAAARGFLEKNM